MKMPLILNLSVLSVVFAGGSIVASAQDVKVDSQQTQLMLAAASADTAQQELEKAGALGFRPMMATTRGNGELVVLLQRDLKSTEKVQLHLVATTATKTFEKEIAESAAQGYRAVPQTFLNKPTGLLGNEIVVVMERTVNPTRQYEYKLVATNQTSTLKSEWGDATSLGYKPLAFLTRAEVMLLMEREKR
jgi:hypothetical protein